jgi:hypothetical protein
MQTEMKTSPLMLYKNNSENMLYMNNFENISDKILINIIKDV